MPSPVHRKMVCSYSGHHHYLFRALLSDLALEVKAISSPLNSLVLSGHWTAGAINLLST